MQTGHYVKDFAPDYYSRVFWPMLKAERILGFSHNRYLSKAISRILDSYDYQMHVFKNWSFSPSSPAFSHTVAYTLRGLLEIYLLLDKNDSLATQIQVILQDCLVHLSQLLQSAKFKFGSISSSGALDSSYICATGSFQLSLVYLKYFLNFSDPYFSSIPARLTAMALPALASSDSFWGLKGGVYGSLLSTGGTYDAAT